MSPRTRRILFGLFALALAVVAAWIVSQRAGGEKPEDAKSSSPQASILPVNVLLAQPASGYTLRRSLAGEVLSAREGVLAFELSGRVLKLHGDVGDLLTPEKVVAEIDQQAWLIRQRVLLQTKAGVEARLREMQIGPRPEVIRAAEAVVTELAARLTQAERDNRRAKELVGRDSATQSEADDAASTLEAVAAQLDAAKARLAELNAGTRKEQLEAQSAQVKRIDAELEAVALDITKTSIKAEFPMVVTQRLIDEGSVVAPGQVVMRGIEAGLREARIGVPASMVTDFSIGQEVTLSIAGQSVAAKVKALVPTVDPRTRTRQMMLVIGGRVADSLSAGQLVELNTEQAVKASGFWLPTTALVRGARGLWGCFIAKPKPEATGTWVIERAYLHLLHTDGERAYVEGSLSAGSQVVANGTHRVVPGQQVSLVRAGR